MVNEVMNNPLANQSLSLSNLAQLKRKRKRLWFVIFAFVAIVMVSLIILVRYTLTQLEWERFHQHRLQAEAIAQRLNTNLQSIIDIEEQRAIGEYRFIYTAPNINDKDQTLSLRSDLSILPLQSQVPGIMGYFQIDADNQFSTPLLPESLTLAREYGLSIEDYNDRAEQANRLADILIDNNLPIESNAIVRDPSIVEAQKSNTISFEKLRSQKNFTPSNNLGRVDELLERSQNNDFAQRSIVESEKTKQQKREIFSDDNSILSNKDIIAASPAPAPPISSASSGINQTEDIAQAQQSNIVATENAIISLELFESEVEPFQTSLLQSGHIIVFRSVWTKDKRLIQGMLLNKTEFFEALILREFINSPLSDNTRLAIAYGEAILAAYGKISADSYGYLESARQLSGTALFETTLFSPFDNFNIVFTVGDLTLGSSTLIVLLSALVLLLSILAVIYFLNRYSNAQQQLMNQQQDFISSVSHELKTPLTSIRMYGEMLKEGWVSDTKRHEYYHFIFDESERLSRLINNVLQLAKLNRNTLSIDLKQHSIAKLISLIESKLSDHVASKGFTLNLQKNIDRIESMSLIIDEDLFVQVMINIVDNALKYAANADSKDIDICFSLINKSDIEISVRDYGPGIKQEKLAKIFDLFYRNENELTRETQGTGIGLSLVSQYIQLMRGDVKAVNKSPGLAFIMTFPCK